MKTQLKPAREVFKGIRPMDYTAHNAEVDALWSAYRSNKPPRVPMILGVNCRYIMLDQQYNPEGVCFQQVFEDPDLMLEMMLRFAYFMQYHLPSDRHMGLPESWTADVLCMNTYEAEWFGARREYINNDLPDCRPFIHDENKNDLFKRGIPDPFSNNAGFVRDCCGNFRHRIEQGYTYEGLPLTAVSPPALMGTDGPFTVACAIRGASEMCLDLYEDPGYAHELLNFITEATIVRIKAWRKLFKQPEVTPDAPFAFADDSIALLSRDMYREFVLPYHKKLTSSLGNPALRGSTHLCGDATHHFKVMRDELNIFSFDTGFPVNHGELVQTLGPEVAINGGPTVGLLLHGSPDEVAAETKRILREVMPHTLRFVLREANNLPPRVPEANVAAMYAAAKSMPYCHS